MFYERKFFWDQIKPKPNPNPQAPKKLGAHYSTWSNKSHIQLYGSFPPLYTDQLCFCGSQNRDFLVSQSPKYQDWWKTLLRLNYLMSQ